MPTARPFRVRRSSFAGPMQPREARGGRTDAVRAVVVVGGDADAQDVEQLAGAELVIAADGGARFLEACGRRPNVLVGDLDSVDAELVERLEADGVEVERHPVDKDATDAELAIERALAAGATRITVIGAFAGKRLDHELGNLLLLADAGLARRTEDLRMVRSGTIARAVHGPGSLELEADAGGRVGLLPVGGEATGVTTRGLRFALDAETLHLGRTRGLANEVVSVPASVSLESGVLLVVESTDRE
jgi:thiamine pyrophosphokinase